MRTTAWDKETRCSHELKEWSRYEQEFKIGKTGKAEKIVIINEKCQLCGAIKTTMISKEVK